MIKGGKRGSLDSYINTNDFTFQTISVNFSSNLIHLKKYVPNECV